LEEFGKKTMETFAYLHIAAAYEESLLKSGAEECQLRLLEKLRCKKLLTKILLLFFALNWLQLNLTSGAQALERGDRGAEVRDLQTRLNAAGYYQGKITGYYGRLTEAAVKRFQRAKKLPVVGIAGSQTYAALRASEGIVARQPNRSITAVAHIQRRLIAQGYDAGKIDGIYGAKTRAAVKRFQQDHGLIADGIVGSVTNAVLAT
jgi:peptidoglycan hydrolase-like protein with peptidoglycan-binding domain